MNHSRGSTRLPRGMALLFLLLEPRHRDLFAGDLLEEYERFVLPMRTANRARLWLWSQALRGSLVGFAHRIFDRSSAARTFFSGGGLGGGGGNMDMLGQDLRYAGRRLIAPPWSP